MYSYNMAQIPKPLVLLCSRTLTEAEKKELNQHYSNVVNISAYNSQKKITEFNGDTVVTIDIRNSDNRLYWSMNSKLLDANDPVVWIRSPADEDENGDLKYKYECKRFKLDCKDRVTFLFHLFQTTMTKIVGRKTKLLSKLLNCVCGSSDK